MKQPRIMQTIKNGRRIPLDVDVIIFSMEQRKIVESKNRDKEKIINTAVNEKKVGHSKIRLITKSTAFASSVNLTNP
jgi:hypothetical protein